MAPRTSNADRNGGCVLSIKTFRNILPVLLPVLLAGLALLAGPCEALASEGHEPRWGDFAWRVVNLVIFVGILWYFVGGLTKRFLKGRQQTIKDTLDELEKRRKEAREHLDAIEARIANLDAERKAILEESKAQAARLRQNIVDEARRQAGQIVDQARRAAENEGRAMRDQVRATLADEIVEATEKALRGKLTEQDHDRLIANSLDKVVLR